MRKVTKFYDDGSIKLECYYKDNKLNGEYKEWHKNSYPKIEAIFKNGKLDDLFKLYTKDNKLLYRFWFDNGKITQGHIWFCYYNQKILNSMELDKNLIEW